MWTYNYMYGVDYSEELTHHGIKGMKWGVRRYQNKNGSLTPAGKKRYSEKEEQYREKLSNITKNKNANPTDVQRFKYRNQSLPKRVAKRASNYLGAELVTDLLKGNISRYATMNKQQLAVELGKKAARIAAKTAVDVGIQDALAKSASKRYTDSGKKKSGTKDHLITKETWIESGVKAATVIAPGMLAVGAMKLGQVSRQRAEGEAAFNRWGQNILSQTVDNIIWQSDDASTVVIDNRNRK